MKYVPYFSKTWLNGRSPYISILSCANHACKIVRLSVKKHLANRHLVDPRTAQDMSTLGQMPVGRIVFDEMARSH